MRVIDPPVFAPLPARRLAATSSALDALGLAAAELGHVCLRLAPDELLVVPDVGARAADAVGAGAALAGAGPASSDAVLEHDPHAIDVVDTGWSGALVARSVALDFLSWATTWRIGDDRPVLLQGMAAGVPVKVWLPADGAALVLVATSLAHDLQERWR